MNGIRYLLVGFALSFSLAVSTELKVSKTVSSSIADSLRVVGDSLIETCEFSKAIKVLQKELALRLELGDSHGKLDALNSIGRAYNGMGKYDSALVYAGRVLETRDSVAKAEIAQAYHTKGYAFAGMGRYDESLSSYKLAVDLRFRAGDSTGAASSLNNLAGVYSSRGEYKSALATYKDALKILLALFGTQHADVASTYHNIGVVYGKMGLYAEAFKNHERALGIRKKVFGSQHPSVAESYCSLGVIYRNLGQFDSAIASHERALEIELSVFGPMSPAVASSHNNLGIVYLDLGLYDRALLNHDRAITIQLATLGPTHPDVASSYANIGEVYRQLGAYKSALENHLKAIQIFKDVLGSKHPYLAGAYHNLAMVYVDLGEYQEALENYERSLAIQLEVLGPEHPDVALAYHDIGNVYDQLGEYERALENLERALAIFLNVFGQDHLYVAGCYDNIGDVYFNLGFYADALKNFKSAISIRTRLLGAAHPDVAVSYSNIGSVYQEIGEFETSLENYNKALGLFVRTHGEKHLLVAESYAKIGSVYEDEGRYGDAFMNYEKALSILLELVGPNHPSTGTVYHDVGCIYRYLGKQDSALVCLERSIDVFENSRTKLESEELRAAYTRTVTERYEAIISLLIEMGRPKEAFEYLERSKSKAIQDVLAEFYEVDVGKGEIRMKIEESRYLASQVEALENQIVEEEARPDSLRNRAKIEHLSRLLAQTKEEYFRVAAQIQADPDYTFAVKVEPVELGVIRQDIPLGQNLLMIYSAGEELYLFLVSNEGYEIRSLPVGRDSLDKLIATSRRLCGAEKAQALQNQGKLLYWSWRGDTSEFYRTEVAPLERVLAELYSYLVQPFEDKLSGARVVTFIPSGNLYYVPWGALMDVEKDTFFFLTERYNWNVLTSTELLRCIYRRKATIKRTNRWSLLLVANPSGANLPESEAEVASIEQSYPNSTVLTGARATEPEVISASRNSNVLHLATHCILDAENPWESYVYLAKTGSTDGRWTASEISGESWQNMRLVTLSACETVLGGSRPGLELESMAKAFSLAMECPPSIVATLWPVADESTKQLMFAFYDGLKSSPKSEALRGAQEKLIRDRKYAHPFFWAPFVLIGEWR